MTEHQHQHLEDKRPLSPQPDDHDDENHDQDQHQGRQRSRAACAPCRQRKRKCNGQYPCGTCVRYEYQCEYTISKRPSYVANGDMPPEPQPFIQPARRPPSILELQKHPLTAPGARFHHRSILDPVKTRFVRANSAIAFPRILGMELESESIPRLHSFAWHMGIRAEVPEQTVDVTSLMSWPEMQRLTQAYFHFVNLEFGLLDETDFKEMAAVRFANSRGFNDEDAVLLGVAALGSFFSPNSNPQENDFVLAARNLLIQRSINHPTTNNVAGWVLRTIYLRLTSRPHGSWMSSSITMHQVEASGLHKEIQTIAVVYPAAPAGDQKVAKKRRRLFWVARALNVIMSFEYGRGRVDFDVVTTKKFAADSTTHAHQFVELAELLPTDQVDGEREPDPPGSLCNALTKIEELKSESCFIQLLKADLAFSIYRRLWLMSLTDAKDRSDSVVNIGKAALEASGRLLEPKTPWWNVVHAPFQFICVMLAMGTQKSLSQVQEGMTVLSRIAQTYDTHLTKEAYNQAALLVRMSRRRKEKELGALHAVPEGTLFDDHPSVGNSKGMDNVPNIDWTLDLPFEWETFLNPDLVMSAQQPQAPVVGAFGPQMGF